MYGKKILLLIVPVLFGIILSGCTTKKSQVPIDGGIFKTYNFGETWEQKIFVKKTEEGTRTIGSVTTSKIIFDTDNQDTFYLITIGNGIYKTINGGDKWSATGLSSGTYLSLSIDPRNNDVLYVTEGTRIMKSVDGGDKWNTLYTETRTSQKLVSIQVDPFSPKTIFAASTNALMKSTDYGTTWRVIDWSKENILNFEFSLKNKEVIYIRTNKNIQKSIDGGVSWNIITDDLLEYKGAINIKYFNFDPLTEDILLGTKYGIVRSLDQGTTWEIVPTLFDPAKQAISAVVQDPNNYNVMMFSLKNLLHKTDDGGKTWKVVKTVPTKRTIIYLKIDPLQEEVVYLGVSI